MEETSRRNLATAGRFAALVCAVVALACLVFYVDRAQAWLRGEQDLRGNWTYKADYQVEEGVLQSIDMEAVHAELLPAWILDNAQQKGGSAFDALMAEVGDDPNLAELLRVMEIEARHEPRMERLMWATWAWNRYLDEGGIPWHVAGGVHQQGDRSVFYVKTYEVLFDGQATVGSRTFRERVVRRSDNIGVIEAYLGLTPDAEDGSLVVADRLASFGLDEVWPLMDAAMDRFQPSARRVFAPSVRAAVEPYLTDADRGALLMTASDRFYIGQAVDRLHSRHACGSGFVIRRVPFDGLRGEDLRSIRRAVATTGNQECPEATADEALVLSIRSDHLSKVEGLQIALEKLVGRVARAIAIHEIRHAADDADRPLACTGCPSDLPEVGVMELSAYLTSFADPEVGALAALQACALPIADLPARGLAIEYLSSELGDLCLNGPPPDLADQARALETRLFGRTSPIRLSEGFPERIPVTTRRSPTD